MASRRTGSNQSVPKKWGREISGPDGLGIPYRKRLSRRRPNGGLHRSLKRRANSPRLGEVLEIANYQDCMAERKGFEPLIRFHVYTLSRRAPSTTRPPLRRSPEGARPSYAKPRHHARRSFPPAAIPCRGWRRRLFCHDARVDPASVPRPRPLRTPPASPACRRSFPAICRGRRSGSGRSRACAPCRRNGRGE